MMPGAASLPCLNSVMIEFLRIGPFRRLLTLGPSRIYHRVGSSSRWVDSEPKLCGWSDYPIRCFPHVDKAYNAFLPVSCSTRSFVNVGTGEKPNNTCRHHELAGDSGISSSAGCILAQILDHWGPGCPEELSQSCLSAPISHC